MKKIAMTSALVVLGLAVIAAVAIASGAYNVAADEEHTAFGRWLLETIRERSIDARTADVMIPDLEDPERIRRGAGNYDAMCASCHLAPGVDSTELSRGLNPKPPVLSKAVQSDRARTFWVIKHGLKATGMPSWGESMEDEYIWDLVALVHRLPNLSVEQYAAEVAASGGHSHGGGESAESGKQSDSHSDHSHEEAEPSDATAIEHHNHDERHSHTSGFTDPVKVAQALHAALASGNAVQVERLLAPDVLIMESGNVERSLREYASHHLAADLKFMKQVKYTLERQTKDHGAEFSWVASEGTMRGTIDGKDIELISFETLVLKKIQESWRVAHIHWSSRPRTPAQP